MNHIWKQNGDLLSNFSTVKFRISQNWEISQYEQTDVMANTKNQYNSANIHYIVCSYTFICNKFKTVYNTTFAKIGYDKKVRAVHQLALPGRTSMHDELSEDDFLNEEQKSSSKAAVH